MNIENGIGDKINIYYAKITGVMSQSILAYYTDYLPGNLQERNFRFLKWQDQYLNLFGKLLLMIGLRYIGVNKYSLKDICFTQYGRPYLNNDIDFNISHSGEYVVCVIGKNVKLGVDIEKIRDVHFRDFESVMTITEWEEIICSKSPLRTFFKYWTIKESVIKADGRGLSIPLIDICIKDNYANYDNQSFMLQELCIDKNYSAYLATNNDVANLEYHFIDFYTQKNIK